MKYRKKPVVIEAMQYNAEDPMDVLTWLTKNGEDVRVSAVSIYISTLEGEMTASDGDFIIKGVQGEFYPCKPDIFEATYEKVEE